jgi:DNA-binding NarL/FixJ family response regulator
MALRILLVDDHPAARVGTRSFIQQAYSDTAVFEAGNAADAIAILEGQEFDLVFLDARLPEQNGTAAHVEIGKRTLQHIRDRDGPPVVVMSGETSRELVQDMIALGAATFVPKTASAESTLEAVRRALSGGVWLPPDMIGKGGNAPPRSDKSLFSPLPEPINHTNLGLTPGDFEVLRLALSGLTPKKIALTLEINHDNVKKKMSRLYEKFGTANQASLHAYFAKTGQTLGIIHPKNSGLRTKMKPRQEV